MNVAAVLSDFRALPTRDLRERVHVVRGTVRAAAIAAHNSLAFKALFAEKALGPLTDTEESALRQQILALYDADWRNVREKIYPASLVHDFSWWRLLKLYPRMTLDARRMRRLIESDRHDALPEEASHYPRYYRRNFHFQTDGYFSSESAALYEAQVEMLFSGTASAMRRQVLPPIVRTCRHRENLRILDVACGTGPVLRLLAAALPHARLFGLDLSPHYIAHARRTLEEITSLSLVVENAEQLPFVDGYFDAVTNVYLMHELPPAVRDRVLREIHRVLAPGGTFVLADSIQPADLPAAERHLEHFPEQFHEPFYGQYLHDDLQGRLERAGFSVQRTETHFVTKVIVASR